MVRDDFYHDPGAGSTARFGGRAVGASLGAPTAAGGRNAPTSVRVRVHFRTGRRVDYAARTAGQVPARPRAIVRSGRMLVRICAKAPARRGPGRERLNFQALDISHSR